MKNIKKVFGPYGHKKTRRRIVIVQFLDGTKKSMSSARYVLSKLRGSWLKPEETADHIDGNFENDDPTNLQILSMADNIRKSVIPKKMFSFDCPVCKNKATKELRNVKHNKKQGKAGPFCGKACSRQWQLNHR